MPGTHCAFLHVLGAECTESTIQHFLSVAMHNLRVHLATLVLTSFVDSCYDQLISDLLKICIMLFNISIFMHEICSDGVELKDFCHYLLLFTSKGESRTRRVRFEQN